MVRTLKTAAISMAMLAWLFTGCVDTGFDTMDPSMNNDVVPDMGRPLAGLMTPQIDGVVMHENAIPGRYIVQFADDVMPAGQVITNGVARNMTSELILGNNLSTVNVSHTYHSAFHGFAAKMSRVEASQLAADPRVLRVEQDVFVRQSGTGCADVSGSSGLWGLDRIDQVSGTDGSYGWSSDGSGVHMYIIDSGVLRTHQEFTGRMGNGFDATGYCPDDNFANVGASSGTWYTIPGSKVHGAALTITMSGGSGDGDLYVKKGSAPTTSDYDCRPYLSGNNESCDFVGESNGEEEEDYYIMVNAYSTFSGATINVSNFLCDDYALSAGSYGTGDGGVTTSCSNGHGTQVASVAGGTNYGVAKAVTIHPVRVFDCSGNGSASSIIAGVDWVKANASSPAVANMSLSTGVQLDSVDSAVASATASGIFFVVAAGNDAELACDHSPANSSAALTVGATTSSDAIASFSNTGSCVDINAPGDSIMGAWSTSTTGTYTQDGTSFSCPLAAGVAAQYRGANPSASPATVKAALIASAVGTNNVLQSDGGGCGGGGPECGNSSCETGEDCSSCPADCGACGPECGTSSCETGEDCSSCPADCGACGGGGCEASSLSESNLSGGELTFCLTGTDPQIATSGGTGDMDLYVKLGSAPTTASYDCRPYASGNNESCNMTGTGVWYILMHQYSAYSGITLTATTSVAPVCGDSTCDAGEDCNSCPADCGACGSCSLGSSVDNLSVAGGEQKQIGCWNGTDPFIQTISGSGDMDLYIKVGGAPTTSDYTCKSTGGTSVEGCDWSGYGTTGDFYIMFYGYSASSGISLRIE